MVASFTAVSAPQFVVGILLLYVFAVQLGWFPIGGYGTFAHLVLPALTLGVLGGGWYARMTRLGHDRCAAPGLHRDRPGQGRRPGTRAPGPCAAQRGAADRRYDRPGYRRVHERCRGGRVGLRLAGNRAARWQAIQLVDIPIIVGVTTVAACFIVLGNLLADMVAPFVDAANPAAVAPAAQWLSVDRPVRLR